MKVAEISEKLQQVGAITNLSKELGISEKRVRSLANDLGFVYNTSTKFWDFSGEDSELENEVDIKVPMTTPRNIKDKTENIMELPFTDEEIKKLKNIIEERDYNLECIYRHRIYDKLEKVPTDVDTIRCAYNLSVETNDRLKRFSQSTRLPLQDLVELAIIELLEKYKER